MQASLAPYTTHESFDVLISKVWLHSRSLDRSYSVYKREQLSLRLRCVEMSCSYRVNAKRDGFGRRPGVWVTISCLLHSCDGKTARSRGAKSSVALVAASTILPLMLAGSVTTGGVDDAEGGRRAMESLQLFVGEEDEAMLSEQLCAGDEAAMDRLLQRVLRSWRQDLASGGTNNAIRLGGIKRVAAAQHLLKPLDENAVVVDVGSGAGFACCFYALRYGCKVFGVEKSERLVHIARRYAREAGVSDHCTFRAMNFRELTPEWFHQRGVSHVLAFDGVFAPDDWNYLFHTVLSRLSTDIVGASVSKFQSYWPSCLTQRGDSIPNIGLSGSRSSFSFAVWTKASA